MIKLLLDTNICIYIIKQKPPTVLSKFNNYKVGDIGISTITVAELQYGVHKSARPTKNKEALEQFLLPLEIVEFDRAAANIYGEIRANLEKAGTPIGAMDMLIAAAAIANDLILVSNNIKEFTRIPELKLENWV
ncbi:MAG: type II toxin-antitoxin system VapC family toxin [Prochloraceae cyanobacterium]|nr:type II toxin-antitoxin system VapC family toxin [Prochloraceae cyanobacterium]